MPAVMNTIFAPPMISLMRSRSSSAAAWPIRFGACAQSLGDVRTDLQLAARLAALERLCIGIDDDEFDPLHALFDHMIDGIAAATAHTHHLDHRILRLCIHDFKHRLLLKSNY